MALFPRSQEKVEVLPVNALGFAGTFLCRSDDEIDFAKTMGCVNILKAVGQSW
jgi:ATP adenylyltransferase/5',5'''-P-1,P-4-tetraphosphate phosphorylase II